MSAISRAMFLALLVVIFLITVTLVLTIGERDLALTNLKNAEAIIKEKEGELRKAVKANETLQLDFIGCRSELEKLGTENSVQSQESIEANFQAQEAAAQSLDQLPGRIETDRVMGQGPTLATFWIKELFK